VLHLVFEAQETQDFTATFGIVRAARVNAFGEAQVAFGCQRGETIKQRREYFSS
jgi:hypothetical protein